MKPTVAVSASLNKREKLHPWEQAYDVTILGDVCIVCPFINTAKQKPQPQF